VVRSESDNMHPYHIKEYADERVATRLRAAREQELLAAARATQELGEPPAQRRGTCLRIPLLNWELCMQPIRQARASH
jgi:hypothetical protein